MGGLTCQSCISHLNSIGGATQVAWTANEEVDFSAEDQAQVHLYGICKAQFVAFGKQILKDWYACYICTILNVWFHIS